MYNIFGKKCDNLNNKEKIVLSKEDIINSIPDNYYKKPQISLSEKYTEWRFIMYYIYDDTFIEISKKDPLKDRIFIDNTGTWINYDMDNTFDKFITDKFYFYAE